MGIGIKIKRLREVNNLTQPELACRLGIAQTTLCNIESGSTKKIDFLLMDNICKEFKINFDYFIEKKGLNQVNKDSSIRYMEGKQVLNISEKLMEVYEERINELKVTIDELKRKLLEGEK